MAVTMICDAEVAGPMGRLYMMLPCRHQRASLSDAETRSGLAVKRTCRECGMRYALRVLDGSHVVRADECAKKSHV